MVKKENLIQFNFYYYYSFRSNTNYTQTLL